MISAALASVLSSALTTAGNIALSERQRKMNEVNQDKQNEYNLPVNQIQRMQDAGINPNSLSMSNGGSIAGNTSAGVNPYTTPSLADPMSLISNNLLNMAQGKTENEMRELRKQEVAANIQVLNENAKKLGVDTQYQQILNTFAAARERAAIAGENARTRLSVYQTKQVKQEARKLAFEVDNLLPEEVKQLIAQQNLTAGQLDLVIAQIANTEATTKLTEAQTDVADTQAALNVEQRGLTAQESSNYQALTDKILEQYQATINKLSAETGLTQQEAFYYLYDLAMKHSIRVGGMPLAGQGGIMQANIQQGIMSEVNQKYNK